ncbi:MAG: hypothetical protein IID37_06645 [Planctomycetes bacterium]|nr:hypothetical protein [Planctomycetota bacterium]
MQMLTDNRHTAKRLSVGLGGLVALWVGTAGAQERTLHSVGVAMTGPNDRCGEEIWAMNGIVQGPDSHGTFLAIEDNSAGATSPIPLTPTDCAAADTNQLLATTYDTAYGAARGWVAPSDELLNISLRHIPVPAGNGVRAPIPLPGSLPPNPLPPTITEPTDPITTASWLAAGGDLTITCDDIAGASTGTVSATFHNLVPNGVYTLWGSWAEANGVILVVPFGGLPNTVVANETGDASIERVLEFCALDLAPDGSQLQYVSLAYHGDSVTYATVPSEPIATRVFVGIGSVPFISTIPSGVVTFDQVGFPVNVLDPCPFDPLKTDPGLCGCGVPDTDTDLDGTPDCNDACPADPNKIEVGACGCGVADTDSDLDGTADCNDACPFDPQKIEAGVCGCGVADTDSDFDGLPDCVDPPSSCVAPIATASLVLVSDGDDDGGGRFVVEFGLSNPAEACAPTSCTAELACGIIRIVVSDGELVEIEQGGEECEVKSENGILAVEGPDVFLEVSCTNSAGGQTVQAFPEGTTSDNDSDEDEDEDG